MMSAAALPAGYSQHAGQVSVCDGTKEADERIYFRGHVLTNDPVMGIPPIFRHADAGYDLARQSGGCR